MPYPVASIGARITPMIVLDEIDTEQTTIIPLSKKQFEVELRDETESAVTVYITPREQPKEESK